MQKIGDIIRLLDGFCPKEGQEPWDNCGLNIGRESGKTDKILIALDLTSAVIDEAARLKAGLVITHHPVIFSPVGTVTEGTVAGSIILAAIERKLAVYCMHTNFDKHAQGINAFLCGAFGFSDAAPVAGHDGLAWCGKYLGSINELADRVSAAIGGVKGIADSGRRITRAIVLCGGGGSDTKLIDSAVLHQAEAVITGDVKHHFALYALEKGISVIECSHYLMERAALPDLRDTVDGILNNGSGHKTEVILSLEESDPFKII